MTAPIASPEVIQRWAKKYTMAGGIAKMIAKAENWAYGVCENCPVIEYSASASV